ncbi:MAG: Tim44 domain-containing protein [Clostridia bacterium]|nr:Tim44 domain-containing protein [Clostridia bacterium]
MNKIKKLIFTFIITIFLLVPNFARADVGDFESYDSDWSSSWDSDWGSSSWDSDWGSSSSYDSDWNYSSNDNGGSLGPMIFVAMVIVIIIASRSKERNVLIENSTNYPNMKRPAGSYRGNGYVRNPQRSENVAEEVRKNDKYFNDEKFLAWTKNLFVKLQTAWSERNFETIRPLETEDLFEQHSRQLKGYINRKQINKMERISVNFAELVSYAQDNEKDILIVALNSSMLDYIVDEASGKVLKGSKDNRLTNTYKLTFIRKKGIITEEGTGKLKTTNCPNCGAPTTVTSSGKCDFCGTVITIGSHDWVLGDMERY